MFGLGLTEIVTGSAVFGAIAMLALPWKQLLRGTRPGKSLPSIGAIVHLPVVDRAAFGKIPQSQEPSTPAVTFDPPAKKTENGGARFTQRGPDQNHRRGDARSFPGERARQGHARWGADRTHRILLSVRVVDGDTIDDLHTGIRYRLANIDAPETGDNARCYSERVQGERAKQEAEKLLLAAKQVEARPTGKIDKYGRTVAYILADGQDLGVLLIQRGFARPWADSGYARWCGDKGALLQMAKELGVNWNCRTCGATHVCRADDSAQSLKAPAKAGGELR
jgi:endonuclease YncB( thermonuclease family)